MGFRLSGLDPALFARLFTLDDERLAARCMRRVVADSDSGYPCRVSLQDARRGEVLLLLPFEHLPAPSPYRASGPVFVRQDAVPPVLAPGEVPASVVRRLISLRAYAADGTMRDADVHDGSEVAHALARMFLDPAVVTIHLHHARQGCYACAATRA
jgi:hypothetical protein